MTYVDKFNTEYLKGIQEHVYKWFNRLPNRCRLAGMTRDLDPGELRALVYFNASITILNHMGALKDGSIDFVVPDIFQHTTSSIWEE